MSYHITDKGPRACHATKRPCPLGGEHFETRESAEQAFAGATSSFDGAAPGSLSGTLMPLKHGSYYGVPLSTGELSETLALWREHVGEDKAALMEATKAVRDGLEKYHLTVVEPREARKLSAKLSSRPLSFSIVGIGTLEDPERGHEAWYALVSSDEVDRLRKTLGLPPKDLHVTLGFIGADIHGRSKGLDTLVLPSP